jgi:hypothetical protein
VLHFLSSLSLNQVVKASRSHQIFHEEVHIWLLLIIFSWIFFFLLSLQK